MATRISPEEALARGREVIARAPPKTLAVTIAALHEVSAGERDEVTLGGGEARALLEHLGVLTSTAKSAAAGKAAATLERNTARADAAHLSAEVREMRGQVEGWIARGAELLGRLQ